MTEPSKKTKKNAKPNVGSDPTKGAYVRRWQVGIYACSIGATAVFLALALFGLVRGQFIPAPAVAALVIGGVTWALVTHDETAFPDPGGIKLGANEPGFVEFVNSVAHEVGAPGVDSIHIVIEPRIVAMEETRYLGLQLKRRALLVGLPYLHSMTQAELASAIAHHLGHYADTEYEHSVRGMRALRAGSNLIAVERNSAIDGVFGSYARKMFRSFGGVGTAQEAAAERVAVEAYGTEAMMAGLFKLDDVASAWDQMLRDYVAPALQGGAHPADLFDGFERLLASPERAQARAADVEVRQSARNEFDPHHSPGERLAEVSQWDPVVGRAVLDDGDLIASSLLDPLEKTAEIVVGKWANKLMDARTEPQSWQQLAEDVFSVSSHNLAVAGLGGDVELSPAEQFESVLDWSMGDWEELDETLTSVKSLKRQEPPERRVAWATALVTEAASATESYSWNMNWDGKPDLLDADGAQFDAQPIVDLLVSDQAAGARQAFERAVGQV